MEEQKKHQPKDKNTEKENLSTQPKAEENELPQISSSLMPELEELVAKNPNKLIGCGG